MTLSVLLLSDTHLRDAARIPQAVLQLASRAQAIVHAGDVSEPEVLSVLEQFAPVTAVAGNVDSPQLQEQLELTQIIEVGGVRIGVVHDAGRADGRHARLCELLPGCDVRVYGHSHMPELTRASDGSWAVNPGSPTQKRRAQAHTVAWMQIDEDAVASLDLVEIDP